MADNVSDDLVERKLRAAALDKDNFPRMNSERWLPVGLGLEAADTIADLRDKLAAAAKQNGDLVFRHHEDVARLEIARKALENLTNAMRFVLAFYEPGQRHLDTEVWKSAEAGARFSFKNAEEALRLLNPDGDGK